MSGHGASVAITAGGSTLATALVLAATGTPPAGSDLVILAGLAVLIAAALLAVERAAQHHRDQ